MRTRVRAGARVRSAHHLSPASLRAIASTQNALVPSVTLHSDCDQERREHHQHNRLSKAHAGAALSDRRFEQ